MVTEIYRNKSSIWTPAYETQEEINISSYVDSNQASDRNSRKSTTTYYFLVYENYISWKSQLQPIVSFSTIKVNIESL